MFCAIFVPDRKQNLNDLRQRHHELTFTQKLDTWQILILLLDHFTKTVIDMTRRGIAHLYTV